MTHKEAVQIAYKWIVKNGGVGVAFRELKSIAGEIPDVIGFSSWESIMIECKVSRADFFQDRKKAHRSKGMGNWRFYCCPKGMIQVHELPERWGLIYIENGRARIVHDIRKKSVPWESEGETRMIQVAASENKFDCDFIAERRIMYTALRRLFLRGHVESIYENPYK